ncbi:nucleotidyltransferase family protein [Microcystis sp. BLCC-F210]|uniref:nucleotidyltransferase family protein n=1 Tax=Microcystis sp. BLCC-F210 TaxID=3342751 RepID=UPI0035C8BE35
MSQIQTFHQQAIDLAEAAAVTRLRGAIDLPTEKIADFCQRWQVTEFALFGSVLRDDFRPDSDIDKYLSKINYTYLTPSCLLPLAFCLSLLGN